MDRKIMRKRSQELRKNPTLEEKILWYEYLRTYPIQWNRQKVIGNYIVDFYCRKLNLVIELDGSQHYEEQGLIYDEKRTAYLESLGLKVLRIQNREIKKNLPNVCDYIDEEVRLILLKQQGKS